MMPTAPAEEMADSCHPLSCRARPITRYGLTWFWRPDAYSIDPSAPQPPGVTPPPAPSPPAGPLPLPVGGSGGGSSSGDASRPDMSSGCVPVVNVTYITIFTVAPTKTVDGSHVTIWATGFHITVTQPLPGPGVPSQSAEYVLGEGFADLQAGSGGGAFGGFGGFGGFDGFGGGNFGGFGDHGG